MDFRHNGVFLKYLAPQFIAGSSTVTVSSMTQTQPKLILWTGKKHSGKTTNADELAKIARSKGFTVAGLLALSLYRDGRLIGFDAFDLQSENRAPLSRYNINDNEQKQRPRQEFRTKYLAPQFIAGLKLGDIALSPIATKSSALIIVDEFGPLELDNRGWRTNIDSLLASSDALIVLVVRQELIDAVKQLYKDIPHREVIATERDSIRQVITLLKNRQHKVDSKMIKLDGMLMVGSAGANVGKTELACAIMRKFSKSTEIIGIKVTTIKAKDGQCPRGGQGCGVCSSLEGNFYITRETNTTSGKDTARLLAAGASRVFWLRVMKTHLKEGIAALLDIIGPDAISICESNSLRQVIEPGLFLIIKDHHQKAWKSSARQGKKCADRVVVSDGNNFDFDIDQIKLANGKWLMQEKATAIIIAGGDSLRMDTDKSMLPIDGQPMIEKIVEQLRGTFDQILISANETEKFAFLGFDVIPDRILGQGPLMGIASALQASANELNFVVACDIPYIDLACVRNMLVEAKAVDLVIPTTGNGKHEPLFAVYRKSALGAINEVLSSGGRKISDVFSRCRVKYIELGEVEWFTNLNTMAEYEEFCKINSSHQDAKAQRINE